MIHRDVEEPLDLLCMQIHCQHATYSGGIQQIRDQFGCNGDPRLIFPVLARVPEEWNHRCDTIRAGPPCRIHHDQQLHQMLVSRRTGRLNDENVVASDVFLDPYVGLAVGKRADRRTT